MGKPRTCQFLGRGPLSYPSIPILEQIFPNVTRSIVGGFRHHVACGVKRSGCKPAKSEHTREVQTRSAIRFLHAEAFANAAHPTFNSTNL